MSSLIEIENLKVMFRGDRGQTTHAVETVSFELARGVTLGLVGESRLRQERHRPCHHGTAAERIRRRFRACGLRGR